MKITTLSLLAALLLSGCGIKPDSVSAPKTVTHDAFPHTYPDPRTVQP